VIEVSDSTFRYDRKIKVPLYARYGIPEYWIVEIESARLHFFRSLVDGSYTDVTTTSTPGVTELPGLGGKAIDLNRLLTPRGMETYANSPARQWRSMYWRWVGRDSAACSMPRRISARILAASARPRRSTSGW
jgi:hypothetical protein